MKKRKFFIRPVLFFLSSIPILLLVLILFLQGELKRIKQPILFNHKIHAENDIACLDCHQNFEEQATSGRPTLDICEGCHEEPQGESKEEKKLIRHIQEGKEIEWQRLYQVPEDVYFSHRRHVVAGELDCDVCHGDIGESTRPPSKPENISMGKCMKCHDENAANNDCIACHR